MAKDKLRPETLALHGGSYRADPVSGAVVTETQSLQNQNTQDQTEITNDQQKLTLMQTNLQTQMAQANALIATLQNQTNFLQGLFQADTSTNPNAGTVG